MTLMGAVFENSSTSPPFVVLSELAILEILDSSSTRSELSFGGLEELAKSPLISARLTSMAESLRTSASHVKSLEFDIACLC